MGLLAGCGDPHRSAEQQIAVGAAEYQVFVKQIAVVASSRVTGVELQTNRRPLWRVKFESQDGSNVYCVYLDGPAHPANQTDLKLLAVWDCHGDLLYKAPDL